SLVASPENGGIRFSVRDTGEGIPPEHLSRVFDRFFQVPGRRGGGAGFGLSIVRDVAEAHGGTVGVESTPGAGSLFWLTVPAQPPVQAPV
ncbi:MAG TPA: HAMP domain-containing sensor histidine kinase, partial [Myxococcaceae bacterium]|nr:HAMP domain-containing sensor histidine kinase [Myxococcaceae bacterium]